MAIIIPDDSYIRGPAAGDWLNSAGALCVAGWFGIPTSESGRSQYLFKHGSNVNGVDKFSLRAETTTKKFRWSVTAGGVNVQVDSNSAMTVGQLYWVVATWEKNSANGMRLWVDGVEQTASGASTTGQTANYDPGDPSSPIFWGTFHETNSVGAVILENIHIWPALPGNLADAFVVECLQLLRFSGDVRFFGCLSNPALQILFDPIIPNTFPSIQPSGFPMGISPSDIFGAIDTSLGMLGMYDEEPSPPGRGVLAAAAGAAVPGPWIDFGPRLAHPVGSVVFTGLTPGAAYEVIATAFNSEGTESPEPSVPLVSSAGQVQIKHIPKKRFIG